jgi:hypothetical protein
MSCANLGQQDRNRQSRTRSHRVGAGVNHAFSFSLNSSSIKLAHTLSSRVLRLNNLGLQLLADGGARQARSPGGLPDP